MAFYDVWDTDTNNVVGHYATEIEALRLVHGLLDTYGDSYADDLQLGGRDDHDDVIPPLGGPDLAARARAAGASLPQADHRQRVG